jgi:hypothetical protein
MKMKAVCMPDCRKTVRYDLLTSPGSGIIVMTYYTAHSNSDFSAVLQLSWLGRVISPSIPTTMPPSCRIPLLPTICSAMTCAAATMVSLGTYFLTNEFESWALTAVYKAFNTKIEFLVA